METNPVPISLPIDEAIRLACEFVGRPREQVFSARFRSAVYMSSAAAATDPHWLVEIAVEESVYRRGDEAGYVMASQVDGSVAVFEDGSVGWLHEEVEAPELRKHIGAKLRWPADHPRRGFFQVGDRSYPAEANEDVTLGQEVVVIAERDGGVVVVGPAGD